jgi:hypothetical protein
MRTKAKITDGDQSIKEMIERLFEQQEKTLRRLLDEFLATKAKSAMPTKTDVEELTIATPRALDQVKELLKSTEDLRVENGNVSATAVATAFGVSMNQLAKWIGRTRQALAKTPDADSLQSDLTSFEHIARLRSVLPKAAFLKWLRMPNAQLDGAEPLNLLNKRQRHVIVELVDDMLTGAPT